jgi:hypothetical protein
MIESSTECIFVYRQAILFSPTPECFDQGRGHLSCPLGCFASQNKLGSSKHCAITSGYEYINDDI